MSSRNRMLKRGVERLDQVVLEQQRLGLGAHHRRLQARDPADHVADARRRRGSSGSSSRRASSGCAPCRRRARRRRRRSSGRRPAAAAAPPLRPAGARARVVGVAAVVGHGVMRYCRRLDNRRDALGHLLPGRSTTTATSASCWRLAAELAGARRAGAAVGRRRRRRWPGWRRAALPGVEVRAPGTRRRRDVDAGRRRGRGLRLRPAARASSQRMAQRAGRRAGSTSSTSAPRPTSSAARPALAAVHGRARADQVVLLPRLHAAHRRPAARAGPAASAGRLRPRRDWLAAQRHARWHGRAPASACSATPNAPLDALLDALDDRADAAAAARRRRARRRRWPRSAPAPRAATCAPRCLPLAARRPTTTTCSGPATSTSCAARTRWCARMWAGAPFVWQIYPQHDGAHAAKLEALLARMQASAPLRRAVARVERPRRVAGRAAAGRKLAHRHARLARCAARAGRPRQPVDRVRQRTDGPAPLGVWAAELMTLQAG